MDETQLEHFIIIGRALVLLVAIALIIPAGRARGGTRCAGRGSARGGFLAARAPKTLVPGAGGEEKFSRDDRRSRCPGARTKPRRRRSRANAPNGRGGHGEP